MPPKFSQPQNGLAPFRTLKTEMRVLRLMLPLLVILLLAGKIWPWAELAQQSLQALQGWGSPLVASGAAGHPVLPGWVEQSPSRSLNPGPGPTA